MASCDLTQDAIPEHIWSSCFTEKTRLLQLDVELELRAKQATITWLETQNFSSFITLTLDDHKTIGVLGKMYQYITPSNTTVGVQRFTNNLNRVLNYLGGCPDDPIGKSVWVMEKQKRGAWHAHILSTCGEECAGIIAKIWKLGFCDVQSYDSLSQRKRAHSQYIMKYMHKSSFIGFYSRELDTYPMDYHDCPGLHMPPVSKLDKRRINDAKMWPANKKFMQDLDLKDIPTVDVWEVIRRGEKRLYGGT